jgi:hypothetical protein
MSDVDETTTTTMVMISDDMIVVYNYLADLYSSIASDSLSESNPIEPSSIR